MQKMVTESERVLRVKTAAIISCVRQRYGYLLDRTEAGQLARFKTIAEALATIDRTSELYRHSSNSERIVHQVMVESVIASAHAPQFVDTIIQTRHAMYTRTENTGALQQRVENERINLSKLSADIKGWGGSYRSFLSEISELYKLRLSEIMRLNLTEQEDQSAIRELDDLFVAAVAIS
jgi:hypothetical protein